MENVKQVIGRYGMPLEWGVAANGSPITTTSTTGASKAFFRGSVYVSFQLISAAAATGQIQGTNDKTSAGYVDESTGLYVAPTTNNWVTLGTITLGAAGSDGYPNATVPTGVTGAYIWSRVNLTACTAATQVLIGF